MVPPPVAPEHEELSEQLNAYLDGELDAHARASVEAHLRTCLACQAELEQLRITRSALQALAPLRAPRPFTVTAPEPLDATGDGWLARLLPWTWRAGAFAAAGCLLVGMATVALPGPGAPGGAMLASQAVEKAAPAADSANTSQRAAAPAAPAVGAANAPIPQSAATPPGAAAAARSQQDTRDTFSGNSAPGAPPAAANAPSAA